MAASQRTKARKEIGHDQSALSNSSKPHQPYLPAVDLELIQQGNPPSRVRLTTSFQSEVELYISHVKERRHCEREPVFARKRYPWILIFLLDILPS